MGFSEKLVTLKLSAAVVIDGAIQRAGTLVEMVESEAKDLLRRGKAEIHHILEEIEGKDDDAANQAAAAAAVATAKAAPKTADAATDAPADAAAK